MAEKNWIKIYIYKIQISIMLSNAFMDKAK